MSEKSLQKSTSDIPYSACLNGILAASTATAPQRNVVFPIDQGKFLRKVLYKLEQLSEAVKSLNDRVDTRLGRVIDADESMFSLKENINNMDDFNENESQLAEEPMKRKLVKYLILNKHTSNYRPKIKLN
ncbi:uncharacterized protein LOC136085134 [Hydra vulgaris]|uniref:Uncharacterized protein LOC136085134 n=1 Tax=Hydra vulgaris TaxID=6087 RepID=A0ABM4CL60_HYDVU